MNKRINSLNAGERSATLAAVSQLLSGCIIGLRAASTLPSTSGISDREQGFRHHKRPTLRTRDFYHRRHQGQKKLEKEQAKLQYLLDTAQKATSPRTAAKAKAEAAEYQKPQLERNMPVMPPAHVAAAITPPEAKAISYTIDDLAASAQSGQRQACKVMDVLSLKVGYSRDAQYALPEEVKAFVLDQSTFCLYGIDKNQVTQIASNIRRIRPPEPYKGHGVRIVGESIKLKERNVK